MKIEVTRRYDWFKTIPGNRPIDPRHVMNLKNSIREENLNEYIPIFVDKNFGIVEGQHRFHALQELNLPVFYVKSDKQYSTRTIQKINCIPKAWSARDFISSYVQQGNADYIWLDSFMKEFNLSSSKASVILKGTTNNDLAKIIRTGNFKLNSVDVNKAREKAERLKQYEEVWDLARSRLFYAAMCIAFRSPDFSHEHMLDKLATNRGSLYSCTTTSQYLKQIEDVYNYGTRRSNKIRFF